MLFYLILGLAALLGFSLIRAGRRVFYQLAISSTSVLNVMLGNQDEEAKLEELQKETGRLIFSLFAFILLTVIAVAVIIGSTYAYALVQDIPFEEIPDWSGWQGVLAISIGATIPFLILFKKNSIRLHGGFKKMQGGNDVSLSKLIASLSSPKFVGKR